MALSAAALVPLTPLFWPLVWNDFRELQLAGPFVLWAVQGVRSRSAGLGRAWESRGMLACRQEYRRHGRDVRVLAPARPRVARARRSCWRRTIFLIGLLWLFVRLLRLSEFHGRPGMLQTISSDQFLGPKAAFRQTLATSLETLLLGMGAWAVLACLAPRVAILALPWIWGPCSGRWAMRLLSTSEWHHVRYVMPMAAITAGRRVDRLRATGELVALTARGPRLAGGVWLGSAPVLWGGPATTSPIGCRMPPCRSIATRPSRSGPGSRQVGADDAVIADYELSAPLSSRRQILRL